METDPAAIAELVTALPTSTNRLRKPLRCIVTEAVRDKKIQDVPTGLVENDNVASMLEQDYQRASLNLNELMESQAGAEMALQRRQQLETEQPVNENDQLYLQKVGTLKSFI